MILNRAKASTATTGTGSATPGAAVSPFQSWAAAGAVAGQYYDYLIEDGTAWEVDTGLFNGTTITRPGTSSRNFASSTGALLSLSGSATIACVANKNSFPMGEFAFNQPDASQFTTIVGGTATAVVADYIGKGLHVDMAGNATHANVGLHFTALPAAPYTITDRVEAFTNGSTSNFGAGLFLRNSTNGRVIFFFRYKDGNIYVQTYTALDGVVGTTLATSANTTLWQIPSSAAYFSISVDGSGNITFRYSANGIKWIQFTTTTIAAYLTATGGGALDQAGPFMMGPAASGAQNSLLVPYFSCISGTTSPVAY